MPRRDRRGAKRSPSKSKKPPLTHFLCVPLLTAASRLELEASLKSFKSNVCNNHLAKVPGGQSQDEREDSTGYPDGTTDSEQTAIKPQFIVAEKAIRPVGALHLTIGVMSLNKENLDRAVRKLRDTNIASILGSRDPLLSQSGLVQHADTPMNQPQDQDVDVGGPQLPPSDDKATATIKSLARSISPPPRFEGLSPIIVTLKSLESMHAPHKTSILYARTEDSWDQLLPLCNALRSQFMADGLLIDDQRPLKLHATIVNTVYAVGRKGGRRKGRGKGTVEQKKEVEGSGEETPELAPNGPRDDEESVPATGEAKDNDQNDRSYGHGPNANAPLKIDARDIIEKYKDFVWAKDIRLDRTAICEMGAKKILNAKGEVVSEEYKEIASLPLP